MKVIKEYIFKPTELCKNVITLFNKQSKSVSWLIALNL